VNAPRTVQLLRAAEQPAVPWKNGGGLSREVAVHPPGSGFDAFEWRVSIATVHRAGPFSRFPGIHRHLSVLQGRLSLQAVGEPERILTAQSPPLEFEGETAVSATPLGGAVSDLNIMVRRGRWRAQLERRTAPGPLPLATASGVRVLLALTPLPVDGPGLSAQLGRWDALLLDAAAACRVSAPADFYLLQLEPAV